MSPNPNELGSVAPAATSVGRILVPLAKSERRTKIGIILLLLIGTPALLLGPVIVGSIYWVLGLIWSFYVPWTWVVLGALFVLAPLLFWSEWRSGGSYYANAVLSVDWYADFSDVRDLLLTTDNPRREAIGLVELFQWGPRQILEAVTQFRGLRQLAGVNRLRAAQILAVLEPAERLNVDDLLNRDGSRQEGLAAMAYLLWYEWIAISKDGNHVWLASSDIRQTLKS